MVVIAETGGARERPSITDRPGHACPVIVVRLASYRCGLPIDAVLEVLPAARIAPLPGGPAPVRGVLDLRGELVAVVDGRRCLGLADAPLRPSDRFVVVRVDDQQQALRVDAVDDLVEIPGDDVVAGSSVIDAVVSAAGIARLPDGLLLIHDPARFLSVEDAAALQRALDDLTAATPS